MEAERLAGLLCVYVAGFLGAVLVLAVLVAGEGTRTVDDLARVRRVPEVQDSVGSEAEYRHGPHCMDQRIF